MKLIDYIRGHRRGKDANKLERDAMTDPFLQDAMEGFDRMDGEHAADIELLRNRIRKQTHKPSASPFIVRRRVAVIAASAALLITGIGTLIYFVNQQPPETPSMVVAKEEVLLPATQAADSLYIAHTEEVLSPTDGEPFVDSKLLAAADDMPIPPAPSCPELAYSFVEDDLLIDAEAEYTIDLEIDTTESYIVFAPEPPTVTVEASRPEKQLQKNSANTGLAAAKEEESKHVSLRSTESVSVIMNERYITGDEMESLLDVPDENKMADVFAENEFRRFFFENHQEGLCSGQKATIIANFDIDKTGTPVNIEVTESNCEELKEEVIRLLKESPRWTSSRRKVKMEIKVR